MIIEPSLRPDTPVNPENVKSLAAVTALSGSAGCLCRCGAVVFLRLCFKRAPLKVSHGLHFRPEEGSKLESKESERVENGSDI